MRPTTKMLALLAFAGLVACGCSSNPIPPDPDPVDIADYLPLEDGLIWVYDGVMADQDSLLCRGPITVCDQQVHELGYDYHWIDEDGWHIVDWPWSCDQALIFPRQVAEGTESALGVFTWTCLGVRESVTVPAGTFSDCIRFKEVGVGEREIKTEKHFWLARGVGLVKETSVVGGGCDSGHLFGFDNDGTPLEVRLVWYSGSRD